MALSVQVFGLSSFAILFPQVRHGRASVGVLYATVKKNFGARPASSPAPSSRSPPSPC